MEVLLLYFVRYIHHDYIKSTSKNVLPEYINFLREEKSNCGLRHLCGVQVFLLLSADRNIISWCFMLASLDYY